MELLLAAQHSVNDFYTNFHENRTNGLVAVFGQKNGHAGGGWVRGALYT